MKIPTIKELRQSGWKVRVTHFRYFTEYTGDVDLVNVREMKNEEGSYIFWPDSHGGKTIVELRSPVGIEFKGESVCSRSDGFNRKEGIARAIVRALDIKPKIRKVGSKVWTLCHFDKWKIAQGTIESVDDGYPTLDFKEGVVKASVYYGVSVNEELIESYPLAADVFDTKEELLASLNDEI
jgi:hypothetical protein